MLFLIEYDRDKGQLLGISRFSDRERLIAEDARIELEVERSRQGMQREIVLLEASSEDDLRRTHGRYFKDLLALATPG